MTRDEKLAYHLEMIIWDDVPRGMQLTAAQVNELVAKATDDQKRRAYERALQKSPILLPDER